MSYISLAELKGYLGVASGAEDNTLQFAIDSAQAAIESYTSRRFEALTDTTRYLARVAGDRLWLDGDLCQITSVANGDGAFISASNYVPAPRNASPWYALDLKPTATVSWDAISGEIVVTGRWAASLMPPAHVAQACVILAAYLYRRKDNAVDGDRSIMTTGGIVLPQALPRDVRNLLAAEVRR